MSLSLPFESVFMLWRLSAAWIKYLCINTTMSGMLVTQNSPFLPRQKRRPRKKQMIDDNRVCCVICIRGRERERGGAAGAHNMIGWRSSISVTWSCSATECRLICVTQMRMWRRQATVPRHPLSPAVFDAALATNLEFRRPNDQQLLFKQTRNRTLSLWRYLLSK